MIASTGWLAAPTSGLTAPPTLRVAPHYGQITLPQPRTRKAQDEAGSLAPDNIPMRGTDRPRVRPLAAHPSRLFELVFVTQQASPFHAPSVRSLPTSIKPVHARSRQRAHDQLPCCCKTVPHITLGSIARNTSLDPIFARHEPLLTDTLAALNRAADMVDTKLKQTLAAKLVAKHCEAGAYAVTEADIRRWLLPGTGPASLAPRAARKPFKGLTLRQTESYRRRIPNDKWREWQVPFDTDVDWPDPLRQALTAYRAAWRAKMEEVNDCIAANAETEELVDKPETVAGTVRVAGPFTIEGVIAVEEGPDSPIGGAQAALETFTPDEARDSAVAAAEAHLDRVIRLLKASGVDFSDNKNTKFLAPRAHHRSGTGTRRG